MADRPLMPIATAVWLIDNTSLSFDQIADFCGLHSLQDAATTLFAVRGTGTFYTLVAGRNVVDPGTGNNAWHADAQGRAQSYLVQRAPIESVRDAINELLLLPPPSLAAP